MNSSYSSHEQKLWHQWEKQGNDTVLNELIEYYMYLVHFHVDRIATHLPNNVSKDDIKSFGLLGLYDAIKKFESERNLKFDTYASFRIKGSIIDGLRKEDWLPRTLREKTKKVDRVSQQLEQELQRMPTSEEIAERLDMTADEVEAVVKDTLFLMCYPLKKSQRAMMNLMKASVIQFLMNMRSNQSRRYCSKN